MKQAGLSEARKKLCKLTHDPEDLTPNLKQFYWTVIKNNELSSREILELNGGRYENRHVNIAKIGNALKILYELGYLDRYKRNLAQECGSYGYEYVYFKKEE